MINIILLILGITLSILLNYRYQNKINTKDKIKVERIIKYQIPINIILIFLLIISFYKQNIFTIVNIVICTELYIFYMSIIYNLIDKDKIVKVEQIKSEKIFYFKKQILIMNTLEKDILIVVLIFLLTIFINRYDYTVAYMITVFSYIYIGKTYKIDEFHGKIKNFLNTPLSEKDEQLTNKELDEVYKREIQFRNVLEKEKKTKEIVMLVFLPVIILEILCHGGALFIFTYTFGKGIGTLYIKTKLKVRLKYHNILRMSFFIFFMVLICTIGFIEFILFTVFQGTL